MLTQNNSNNTIESSAQETTPNSTDPRQSILANDNEIVNEEEQNQVINAQPAEEFISNYVNDNQEVTEENTTENSNSDTEDVGDKSNNVSVDDLEAGSDEDLNLDQPL